MKSLAAAGAAATIAVTIVVATAGGKAPDARTLKLTELPGGSFGVVDNPPKTTHSRQGQPRAFSVGDIVAFSVPVADDKRRPQGRVAVQCVVTRPGVPQSAELACTGAFRLRLGQLGVSAAIVGEPSTLNAVVTGGTGAYAGARGTLRSVTGKNGRTTDTIRLLR